MLSVPVRVLIVEENADLARLWSKHLERQGAVVSTCASEDEALAYLHDTAVDMIVADLDLPGSAAAAVADYAAFRHPEARVVFVTASSFFSDGMVFANSPNACAFLPSRTEPADLAAIVTHHGSRGPKPA